VGEVPVLVAERAHLSALQPPGDAVQVESVVALTPS